MVPIVLLYGGLFRQHFLVRLREFGDGESESRAQGPPP
jgi:hypothetical protein